MIKHLVLLKLTNSAIIDELKAGFINLGEEIKEIQKLEIMENAYPERVTNNDLMFALEFNDIADLRVYLEHQKHVAFVNDVIKGNAEIAVFDYEL